MIQTFIQFLTGTQKLWKNYLCAGWCHKTCSHHVDTLRDAFKELLDKNYLLNIRKYTVAESKSQGNNNFELSMDDLKAFLIYV